MTPVRQSIFIYTLIGCWVVFLMFLTAKRPVPEITDVSERIAEACEMTGRSMEDCALEEMTRVLK